MDKSIAKQTIISRNTTPSQIDFISPKMKQDYNEAQDFLQTLPENERIKVEFEIESEINSYYTEPIESMGGMTASQLNEMF